MGFSWQLAISVTICVFSFGVFRSTPLEPFEYLFLAFLLLPTFIFLVNKRVDIISDSQLRVYLIFQFLFLFLIGLSAFQANRLVGQSLFDGLIANYKMMLTLNAFLLLSLLNEKWKVERFDKLLLWMAFVYLLYFVLANLAINPILYQSWFSDTLYVYFPNRIQRDITIFASLYFLFKFSKTNNHIDIGIGLSFFIVPNVIEFQRGELVAFVVVSFLLVAKTFNFRSITAVFSMIVILVGSIIFLFLSFENISILLSNAYSYMAEAFVVVFKGERVSDPSATGRIIQFLYILEPLIQNFLLGNGRLRASVKADFIGDIYFHPADLGIVGATYVFGLLAVIIIIFLLGYCVYLIFQKKEKYSSKTNAWLFFLFFKLILSVQTAELFFGAHDTFITWMMFIVHSKTDRIDSIQ